MDDVQILLWLAWISLTKHENVRSQDIFTVRSLPSPARRICCSEDLDQPHAVIPFLCYTLWVKRTLLQVLSPQLHLTRRRRRLPNCILEHRTVKPVFLLLLQGSYTDSGVEMWQSVKHKRNPSSRHRGLKIGHEERNHTQLLNPLWW